MATDEAPFRSPLVAARPRPQDLTIWREKMPGPRDGTARSIAQRRRDAGMVTAETAILLPALAMLLAGLLWVLAAVVGELRCIDAAREADRLAARGDPTSQAVAVGRELSPAGARVAISRRNGRVIATVRARQAPFGGWAGRLTAVPLRAVATAADETRPVPGRAGSAP